MNKLARFSKLLRVAVSVSVVYWPWQSSQLSPVEVSLCWILNSEFDTKSSCIQPNKISKFDAIGTWIHAVNKVFFFSSCLTPLQFILLWSSLPCVIIRGFSEFFMKLNISILNNNVHLILKLKNASSKINILKHGSASKF